VEAYHDRYQIEKIPLNAYHCKYEISGTLPESVSLYTLKRQFNSDITQRTHTSRKGTSSRALCHWTIIKVRNKLRFRWQASQKCTFLLLTGVPEPHMPPAGGEKIGSDRSHAIQILKHSKGGIAIETKHHMHFEMTPEQYRLLSENAKTCGLSKRAYLIRLLQGHHPSARQNDEMKALRREIHAIGNNINQIARSVNAGIATQEDVQEATELLGHVYEKLYEMGRH